MPHMMQLQQANFNASSIVELDPTLLKRQLSGCHGLLGAAAQGGSRACLEFLDQAGGV